MYRFSAYILTGVAVAGLVYWGGNYRYQQGLDTGLDKLQQYCYTTGGYVVGAENPHTIIECVGVGELSEEQYQALKKSHTVPKVKEKELTDV